MVVGIGIDIIEVKRIKDIAEERPRFLNKIYTPSEILYCEGKKNKYLHFAARFASKEAFFKALGKRINWKDVEIINHSSGKPQLKIKSKDNFPFTDAYVSLSHLQDYAVAVVVLEDKK